MDSPDYTPSDYWDERLSRDYSLRGTGHISYSGAYNAWLYRRKGDVLDRALSSAPYPGDAIDVGSGTGWVVERLIDRGWSVRGCDVSPLAVEKLNDRFGTGLFSKAELGTDQLPAGDGSCGLVTVMDVLYHVTDDELFGRALQDIARVLTQDGVAIVSDGLGEKGLSPADHVRFRSAAEWNAALGPAGLEIATILPLYSWLSRDRDNSRLRRLPDRARGPIEHALERLAPREPHLRCAVLKRTAGAI